MPPPWPIASSGLDRTSASRRSCSAASRSARESGGSAAGANATTGAWRLRSRLVPPGCRGASGRLAPPSWAASARGDGSGGSGGNGGKVDGAGVTCARRAWSSIVRSSALVVSGGRTCAGSRLPCPAAATDPASSMSRTDCHRTIGTAIASSAPPSHQCRSRRTGTPSACPPSRPRADRRGAAGDARGCASGSTSESMPNPRPEPSSSGRFMATTRTGFRPETRAGDRMRRVVAAVPPRPATNRGAAGSDLRAVARSGNGRAACS